MSDVAPPRADAAPGLFNARTLFLLLAVGIGGFAATLVLATYAPDMRSGQNGGGHALSNAAIGFSGIVRLAGDTGIEVRVSRDKADYAARGLMVLTPSDGSVPMGDVLTARANLTTLVVLPKWATLPDPRHRGWVAALGLTPAGDPQAVLAPADRLSITRVASGGRPLLAKNWLPDRAAAPAPRPLQVFAGDHVEPLITDADGRVVLGKLGGDRLVYVLSDPDLLDNRGMRDLRSAAAGLALLQELNKDGGAITFDVTLAGLGRQRSPLRLAFDPPFLAMTLTIVAAMLLAGWQALARFGPAARPERAIAFGKRALVDNSAALIRKAGRQMRLGGRYAEVVRDRAILAFGVPARLRGAAVDDYLDGLDGRRRFTDLARAIETAGDRVALVAAAQALHDWQKEKSR
ncbi:hypothetical protein [uncultured Sphingomonas sp.]|uniref:hypothetical protein n=1 Tax=uncultured Sphingomonas sp. TaxID=158754 RepID=UPI0035C9CB97